MPDTPSSTPKQSIMPDTPSSTPKQSIMADVPGNVADTLLGNTAVESPSPTANPTPEPQGSTPPTPQNQEAPVVGLAPLPENASEDQKRDFANKLRALNGTPNTPAEYGDFGFGAEAKIDTTGEDYKYYSEVFHELGLSKTQAKTLLEKHKDYAEKHLEHIKKQNETVINDYRAKVKNDFVKSLGGEGKFNEFRDTAIRGFKASAKGANMSDQEMSGLLNIMGDDPRFIKIFNGVGKLFREDVLISGAMPSAPEKGFKEMFDGMFGKQGG